MQIKRYDSGKRMNQAVVYGGFAFLAGQVADDTSQDVKGQTAQIPRQDRCTACQSRLRQDQDPVGQHLARQPHVVQRCE